MQPRGLVGIHLNLVEYMPSEAERTSATPAEQKILADIQFYVDNLSGYNEAADHMQEWFEAGAVDAFWVSPDIDDGIDAFVDGVIPILQERGVFHRDHLGAPAQYGPDSRIQD